ncbi:dockerin type I domain-containing protein, partial [Rubripirellula amarantea]|nr:dockerin type I domain-containing protein [Rubripirellula amarantea]
DDVEVLDSFDVYSLDLSDTTVVDIAITGKNDAPTMNADQPSVSVTEGDTATMTGSFGDVDLGDTVTLSSSYGAVVDNLNGTWTWTALTSDGPTDSQTITINANDGTTTTATTFELVVANFAPSFDAGGDETLDQGTAINRTISFNDPGDDNWTGTVNFGDSSIDEPLVIDSVNRSFVLDHVFSSPGTYTVTVNLIDGDGGVAVEQFEVTVVLVLPPGSVEIDNLDPEFSTEGGVWRTGTNVPGFVGPNYRFAGGGNKAARFTPDFSEAGSYEVFVNWTAHPNRASNASLDVIHAGGKSSYTIDQTTGGSEFTSVGVFTFDAGTAGSVAWRTLNSNGSVAADAVRFVKVEPLVIEIDNSDSRFAIESGTWPTSSTVAGFAGSDYRYSGGGDKTARFTPDLITGGTYEVFANWTEHPNRATNAVYEITHANGTSTVLVDQTSGGGEFNSLGVFSFAAGNLGSVAVRTLGTDGPVVADAVRFVQIQRRAVEIDNRDPGFVIEAGSWTTSASVSGFLGVDYLATRGGDKIARFTPDLIAGGDYEVFANWTSHPNRATNAKFEITHAGGTTEVSVNQKINGGTFASLGVFRFDSGTSGSVAVRTLGTNGWVVADAVRWVPVSTESGMAAFSSNLLSTESSPVSQDYSIYDVSQDGTVSAVDALRVINFLGTEKANGEFVQVQWDELNYRPAARQSVDVNGNGEVSSLDALLIINELQRQSNVTRPDAELIEASSSSPTADVKERFESVDSVAVLIKDQQKLRDLRSKHADNGLSAVDVYFSDLSRFSSDSIDEMNGSLETVQLLSED